MAAVFLFIRQDLNRLSDQLGSPEKRSFRGANGILPPQPLKTPDFCGNRVFSLFSGTKTGCSIGK